VDEKTRRFVRTWVIGDLSLRRVISGFAFIYVALAGFAWLVSDRLVFRPHPSSYVDGADAIRLHPKDGATVAARFGEALGGPARAVVLYSHGNAEDLGDVKPLLEILRHHQLDVLGYDYEGYGTSSGAPSEAHLESDILAAYEHLTIGRKIDPKRIVVYGRSVGSGPSVWLASTHPVGGLVLESAFASPFRVVTRVRLLPWDPFPNLERMASLKCPVLVIHAEHDELIPFSQGRALFAAAPEPKTFAPMTNAGHADIPFVDEAAYGAAISAFFERFSTDQAAR
jgi:fermentation-respiration switch protein FrsA (DUF1100 family)